MDVNMELILCELVLVLVWCINECEYGLYDVAFTSL